MVTTLALIPGLPFAGAAVLLLFGKKLKRQSGVIASSLIGSSFALSLMALGELLGEKLLGHSFFEWISAGSFKVDFEFVVDPLTVVMLLVVTGVGTLIHIYSIGYMAADERRSTFFAYLNLFAGSMLVLVMAANFLVLFLGWELVGMCSYLLISFWNDRPEAAAAGKKAFLLNRVGDFGFLIALFLIFQTYGTLRMADVFAQTAVKPIAAGLAAAIPILMLVGAAGKSAQIPLYVWLPDAMEGPTPVSALIHAATMVTAGVYLIARAHVLFEASQLAAGLVVVVGILTAFLAATIAMAQDDIKRVLAYSTISQLGYMFVAVGVGAMTGSSLAYIAGIFHLITHAFFKALLFLGAGSVMHATGGETDMKKMGGLLKALPITGATFIFGWLAISGIPPLAGFFSKEAILSVAWAAGLPTVWVMGVLISGLTAFYMSRQVFLTFFGTSRLTPGVVPHESPSSMTSILQSLAFLAAAGGFINLTLHGGRLTRFLEPVFTATHERVDSATPLGLPEWAVSVFVVSVSLGAIAFAHSLYLRPGAEERRRAIKAKFEPLVGIVRNKYYVDDFYNVAFVAPGKALAVALAFSFDTGVIDRAVNGTGGLITASAARLRGLSTGLVRRYVMAMFIGAVVIVGLMLATLR